MHYAANIISTDLRQVSQFRYFFFLLHNGVKKQMAVSSAQLYSFNYSSEGSDNRIRLLGLLMYIYGEDNTAWYKITAEVHFIPESEGEKQEPDVRSGENPDQVTECGRVTAIGAGSTRIQSLLCCEARHQASFIYVMDEYQPNDMMRYNTVWYGGNLFWINFTYINAINATESMAHLLQCSYQDCIHPISSTQCQP